MVRDDPVVVRERGGGKACGVRHWGRMKEMEGERRRRVKGVQGGNVAQ